MLYVIYGIDAPGSGPRRADARPAHLERLQALHREGRIAMVGPLPVIDAPSLEGGIAGSLIVAEFESLDAAKAWVAADPYTEAGVYASVDIRPFLRLTLS
ncbi:YciI family protein [Panacagrimonas sp.]|uniref:YciI family protein n=1 Tax=Panacagrimonas sp. TaxID=2480088 RepID=UPI003B5246E5